MKALVTGGTGLVGRYIVETLLESGYDVTVAGRTQPADDLFPRAVNFRAASLDPEAINEELCAGIDAIVHAAFDHLPGRYRGGEGDDPARFRRLNLDGSVKLFEAAKRAGVKRFVFLSSRAVYDGVPPGTPLTEDLGLEPTSLYGQIKLLAEQALTGLNGPDFITSSLRLTGVYGDLKPNKWDSLFADCLAGRAVPVRAGTEVHGRDAGMAVRLMLEADPEAIGGKALNVSDVIADTRDILTPLATRAGLVDGLPNPADKTKVRAMPTDRIRTLGWQQGGKPLLDRTLEEFAATALFQK